MIKISVEYNKENKVMIGNNVMACVEDNDQLHTLIQGKMSIEDTMNMLGTLMTDSFSTIIKNIIEQEELDGEILNAANEIAGVILQRLGEEVHKDIVYNVVEHFSDKIVKDGKDLSDIIENLGKISKNSQIVAIDMKELLKQNRKEKSKDGEG